MARKRTVSGAWLGDPALGAQGCGVICGQSVTLHQDRINLRIVPGHMTRLFGPNGPSMHQAQHARQHREGRVARAGGAPKQTIKHGLDIVSAKAAQIARDKVSKREPRTNY
jgi:hypothetical protein